MEKMNLVVVESPTKAKTVGRFLGEGFSVLATMGHIRDLPPKKLGVEVEAGFKPEYVQVVGREEAIRKLKEAAKKAERIYLATDPDREGEAIAFHVTEILKDKKRFSRITFHEITKGAIERALEKSGEIKMDLVEAQQARRILDRLVGYKLSPLLWRKIRRGLSAGRVQSVAVRLIVEREREIEKFVPEEYWEIGCELRKRIGQKREDLPTFLARLTKKNGEVIKVENGQDAKEVVGELKKAGFEVEKVEQKEVKRSPLPPFITSTLQRNAFQKLGFSSKQTMRLAQGLYEKGLITYHRTDSVVLSSEALNKIRDYIAGKYSEDYLPDKPRFFKTKSKLAQEAHEAIRPTEFKSPAEIKFANDQERRLFDLIFKRAVGSQMKEAIYDQTRVFVRAVGGVNVYTLLAEGRVIKFPGWLILHEQKESGEKDQEGEPLPPLERGDELALIKVLSEQKFTQPPPRYNDASLIKALEERGIGRPSTYAPIISTIQIRQYVERAEKKFQPTVLGITVNDFLVDYFPAIVDYDFTAQMEDELDKIARGEEKWVKVIGDFYDPFNKKLEGVAQVAERVSVPTEVTGEKCPKCEEGDLVIRVGRFGKFISCSRFPDCDYKKTYLEKVEGMKCPKCKGDVVVRKTKKGKRFFGCSNYPRCKWASWRKPK